MSNHRYSPEFKDEAVRQIIEAGQSVTSQSLHDLLSDIGRIRAQLRFAHLEAHMRQRQILTAEQVAAHDESRGYE